MQKPQLVAVKWGCNSTPTPVDPKIEKAMEAERWIIVGKGGLQLAQCLFEGKGVKMKALPALRLVNYAIEVGEMPITFPTKHQAEQLIELIKWTKPNEAFENAKAVRL